MGIHLTLTRRGADEMSNLDDPIHRGTSIFCTVPSIRYRCAEGGLAVGRFAAAVEGDFDEFGCKHFDLD
jgi:hypothetical protein